MNIKERIRGLLKTRGWNDSELARRLDIDPTSLTGWWQRNAVPAKRVGQVAALLGTTTSYLTGESDDPGVAATIDPLVYEQYRAHLVELGVVRDDGTIDEDLYRRLLVYFRAALKLTDGAGKDG